MIPPMLGRFAAIWWRAVLRDARLSSLIGAAVLLALVAISLLAPLAGYSVGEDVNPAQRSLGCSQQHWLGTDHLGREVSYRLLLGTRAFVGPGIIAVLFSFFFAIPLGAIAGWSSSIASQIVQTVLGAISSIPRLVFVLLSCAIFGNTPLVLAIAAGVSAIPPLSTAISDRIARLQSEEFVMASRSHGLSTARILFVHLVALATGRIIARQLVSTFAAFMVLECTLSYIGHFGVQEPTPSWGNMLAFEWGRDVGPSLLAPGLALWGTLVACSFAASLFAEADRDQG